MEKTVRANDGNDLKFREGLSSTTIVYKRDSNGNLVLDEKGNPIPLTEKLEYFTE